MNRSRLIWALCAVLLLVAGLACGSSEQGGDEGVTVPEVHEPPAVAVTNGMAGSGKAVPAPREGVDATPTPFAQTVPPPRIVTPTAVVELEEVTEIETADCGLFESPEDAQAYFLTEGGGPFEDPYSLDTNRDGIACNAATDAGAQRRQWDFEDSDGPGPAGTIQPTPTPMLSTTTQSAPPPEPLDLWEVDWTGMQDEGIVRIVKVGDQLTGQDLNYPYDECGPVVGTEASESNGMYDVRTRAGWLWVDVPDSDGDYCVGGYWGYETEVFPMPIYPPDKLSRQRWTITSTEQELVFRVNYEWRNYDIPPDERPYGAVRYSQSAPEQIWIEDPARRYVTVEIGGEERPLLCGPEMLPAAIWSAEEGFVPLTVEEEQVYAGLQSEHSVLERNEWSEETVEAKRAAGELGWYLVLSDKGGWPFYCFNLANPGDLPDTTPCLECYERD